MIYAKFLFTSPVFFFKDMTVLNPFACGLNVNFFHLFILHYSFIFQSITLRMALPSFRGIPQTPPLCEYDTVVYKLRE